MTLRSITLLLVAGAWALAPVLCANGVLAHHCPCGDETACEHESDCVTDPCAELAIRQPTGDASSVFPAGIAAAARPALPALRPAPPARPDLPASAPGGSHLPCPPSDLPLLI